MWPACSPSALCWPPRPPPLSGWRPTGGPLPLCCGRAPPGATTFPCRPRSRRRVPSWGACPTPRAIRLPRSPSAAARPVPPPRPSRAPGSDAPDRALVAGPPLVRRPPVAPDVAGAGGAPGRPRPCPRFGLPCPRRIRTAGGPQHRGAAPPVRRRVALPAMRRRPPAGGPAGSLRLCPGPWNSFLLRSRSSAAHSLLACPARLMSKSLPAWGRRSGHRRAAVPAPKIRPRPRAPPRRPPPVSWGRPTRRRHGRRPAPVGRVHLVLAWASALSCGCPLSPRRRAAPRACCCLTRCWPRRCRCRAGVCCSARARCVRWPARGRRRRLGRPSLARARAHAQRSRRRPPLPPMPAGRRSPPVSQGHDLSLLWRHPAPRRLGPP